MFSPLPLRARVGAALRVATIWLALAAFAFAQTAQPDPGKKKKKDEEEDDATVVLSPFTLGAAGAGYLGVTPGGMKSVQFARELLDLGMLPQPGEFASEGLFSEYDLPLPVVDPGKKLLAIAGAGKRATIVGQPEVTHLVQIGFASGLKVEDFHREPLFLVLVLDVSGSMEPKLDLLKKTALTALAKLHPGDAVAVVSFSEDARTEVAPVLYGAGDWARVSATLGALAIRGGTNIEAGLTIGFGLAQNAPAGFAGRRRVMLITDEMPNIGATSPTAFMAQATEASLKGVGLTTIGVGLDFDANFVRRVSSVSGGNAYWFDDPADMAGTLDKDFDLMVTEVAYDLKLQITPAPGFKVAKVYGVPGDTFAPTPDGGIVMDVPTLFLSHNKGAIYVSLVADGRHVGTPVLARADLSYLLYGQKEPVTEAFEIRAVADSAVPPGLSRGELLVSECEAIAAASQAFYEDNRLARAGQLASALSEQFARHPDPVLAPEARLMAKVAAFLAAAEREPALPSGTVVPDESDLIGVWEVSGEKEESGRWALLPGGHAVKIDQRRGERYLQVTEWSKQGIGKKGAPEAKFGRDRSGLFLARADKPDVKVRLKRVSARG